MKCPQWIVMSLMAVAVTLFATGCNGNGGGDAPSAGETGASHTPDDGHDHGDDHSHDEGHEGHDHEGEHEGPHGGHVIELGRDHKHHLEMVEDEKAQRIVLYALDKDMKPLELDAPSVTLNLIVDGKPKSFELPAAGSGRFESKTPEVFAAIHDHGATGKVRVVIGGTPYTGDVEHHHHDGDHKH